MKETKHEGRTVVEHTSPIWRVAGVALAFGAVGALGYYFQTIGYVEEFATILVITAFFSVSWWARKRPDRLRKRFGAFGLIADAIRESGDRIREDVYARPLRFGVMLGVVYGVAVVLAKAAVVAVLTNLYAWPLAVAAGCLVGALVAAPEFFGGLFKSMSVQDEDPEDADLRGEEDEEDEDTRDELARRRAGGGE